MNTDLNVRDIVSGKPKTKEKTDGEIKFLKSTFPNTSTVFLT